MEKNDFFNSESNLYHFTKLESLIKILISEKFLLSNIRRVNDAGEFSDDYPCRNIEDYRNRNNLDIDEYLPLNKESRAAQDKDLEELKELDDEIGRIYIGCFSYLNSNKIWDKPSLWGNYADKSEGACIVFDKTKLDDLFDKQFSEINFIKHKVKISYLEGSEYRENIQTALNRAIETKDYQKLVYDKYSIKHICWNSEEEYRYIIYLKESERKFKEISIKNIIPAIKFIIIGDKAIKNDKELIIKLKDKLAKDIRFEALASLQFPQKYVNPFNK